MTDDPRRIHSVPPASDTLERFLAGAASPEEHAEVRGWARDRVTGRSHADDVLHAVQHLGRGDVDAEASWEALQTRIGTRPMLATPARARYDRWRATQRPVARLLAAGAVAAGIGLVLATHLATPPVTGRVQTYQTATGERRTLTLRDGTRVTLAPQTTLSVDDAFPRATRTLALVGEAYFDVPTPSGASATATRETQTHPFIVRTGSISTRVLGTTFIVRRYASDTVTRVAVTSGKVSVHARNAITVARGGVAYATDSSATLRNDDAATYTAWVSGRLVFHKAPVQEVLTAVSRWYGMQFRITDSTLAQQHVTATVELGDSAELLRALTLVLDVSLDYERGSTRVITVAPRRADRSGKTVRRGAFDSLTQTIPKEIGR
jgi:transmembrane sensor